MPPTPTSTPKYKRLSTDERDVIANMHAAGCSQTEIAEATGRSVSTISRELARNSAPSPCDAAGGAQPRDAAGVAYGAHAAHELAQSRASRARAHAKNDWLRAYIDEHLSILMTPERISDELAETYPDCWERNISHEAVYEYIWSDDAPAELRKRLNRQRPARGCPDRRGKRAGVGKIPDRVGIEERPAEVDSRRQAGHWEGDTVIGKQGGAALHTEVERQTRYLVARIIPGKSAADTLEAMLGIFGEIPEELRRTLTLDNGTEFVRHMDLRELITTYFARPYHSWERGSNENMNGYLRRFFPKGTDFNEITQEQLDHVVDMINNTPRKCLNRRTPAQAWATLQAQHQPPADLALAA